MSKKHTSGMEPLLEPGTDTSSSKNPYAPMELSSAIGVGAKGAAAPIYTGEVDHDSSDDPARLRGAGLVDKMYSDYPNAYRIPHQAAQAEDPLMAEMHRMRNEHKTPIFGDIIPEGRVGFTLKNGKIGVLAPGRRLIVDPLKKLIATHSVNEDLIQFDQLTIVRINQGQIGLALRNGMPTLLDQGRHWLESPEWRYVGSEDALKEKITWPQCPALTIVRVQPGRAAFVLEDNVPRVLPARTEPYELLAPHSKFTKMFNVLDDINRFDDKNSLDIVRVRPGMLALAWEDSHPAILAPRTQPYVMRAPQQQFVALHNQMDAIIKLDNEGTLDMVRVRPGQVGLYWENGSTPRLCQPHSEPYIFRKPEKFFVEVVSVNQEHIQLGSLHIVTISTGRRGVLWERGVARIVECGQYIINEQNFKYGGSADLSSKLYDLGPFKYVTVEAGEVGIKHKLGELVVLDAGTHCIAAQEGETFSDFVSIQQQVLLVSDLTVTTLDNVDLMVNAVLTFNISDPIKAIKGVKNLFEVLRQRTETTLSVSFSHHNYGDKTPQSASAHLRGRESVDMDRSNENETALVAREDPNALSTKVHDEFMGSMHTTAQSCWGVKIGDLSVDQIKIVNHDLRSDLEQRAVTTVKTETARANAENASQVDLIKAQASAKAKGFEAQGETAKLMAQARAKMEITRVEAEAMRIDAETRAEVVRIMARAEAEATTLKAEAQRKAMEMEAEGTERLGENALKLRMWESQCRIAGEMFKNQRTFIDTNGLPTMSQFFNMNAMNRLGLDFASGLKPGAAGEAGEVTDKKK